MSNNFCLDDYNDALLEILDRPIWDSYRVRVKTCKIGHKRAFYRLIFWTKNQKIIFLECAPCIALKVILQVFTRILYLPQHRVKATYEKYAEIQSSLGMTGAQVAKTILQRMGIHDVTVEQVEGQLTDHYDPSAKAVRLSESVYASSSLAAAAIAAHECGHVLQDVRGYQFMNIRASLVPVANIGANFGPLMVMAGLFLTSLGSLSTVFINLGIILFAGAILFGVDTGYV